MSLYVCDRDRESSYTSVLPQSNVSVVGIPEGLKFLLEWNSTDLVNSSATAQWPISPCIFFDGVH